MEQAHAIFPTRSKRESARYHLVTALLLVAFLGFGCHHAPLIDATPLDSAGMSYDSIQQLKGLNVTAPEVAEIARARQGGLPDAESVEIVRIFHGKGHAFDVGQVTVGLIRAGMRPNTIVELTKMGQLGLGSGELQAMRLAGISDETILEVARHHSEGKAVLSGAALAGMKNTGLRETTLLELARRGVPDSEMDAIIALRRHGANDAEILRHFTGS